MATDFDKEMDSLLRQAAREGEAAFAAADNPKSKIQNPKSAHVDADEISLFAENALPQKARVRVTEHLADCARCRKILSGVIVLNAETASESLHAKEIVSGAVTGTIPWYKKLFAFPQIAFAMGALMLVFSGIIGFIILKNASESQNSSIAQLEKVQETPQSMNSDEETSSNEPYSTMATNANTNIAATSNSTATTANVSTNTMTQPGAAPLSAANSNASISGDRNSTELSENQPKKPAPVTAAPQESPAKTEKKADFAADGPMPPPATKRESENRAEDEAMKQRQAETSQNTIVQNQIQIAPDSRNVQRSLPVNGRSVARKDSAAVTTTETTAGAKEKSAETRTVGGKIFKRADGVWYDSAYNQQKTINIRRDTDEYKKLDSGLRSIAENLGGTIVVVWKSKAYRIQ